jgi:SET domain-containing protein
MPNGATKPQSTNDNVSRRTVPAVIVRRSGIHGRGLFAAEPIRRGTFIGRYEGRKTQRDGAYVLWIDDGERTYGVAGKNQLRFVNHSRRPNAYFDGDELWSMKAIQAGEEITFHYGADWE